MPMPMLPGRLGLLLCWSACAWACAGPAVSDAAATLAAETEALAADPSSVSLRTRLAWRLTEAGHPDTARELLLAGLDQVTDPVDQLRLRQALAGLLADAGNFRAAAESLEMAAGGVHPVGSPDPDGLETPADPERRSLLELASRYRQRAGDDRAALRDLEAALAGLQLSAAEERLLSRLRALEGVQLENPDDAVLLLRQHPDPARRLEAAQFLAGQEFDHAVDVFALALEDSDPRVVQLALGEIGRRGQPMDAALLHPWLTHDSATLRLAALKAVAALAAKDSVPYLIDALDSGDRQRFRIANQALEQISGQVMDPDLDPDPDARRRIAAAWRAWWNGSG